MGRSSASLLALLLGIASAVALASCGGGDRGELLPGTTADQIDSNLTDVQQLVDEGDCVGAEDAVAAVTQEVEDLKEVDLKLKAALEEGTEKLSEVVASCEETTGEETEPALESNVEAEELDEKKPKKEKVKKGNEEETEPKQEPNEQGEGPELPPQSNGEGEEKGNGGREPVEPEAEEEPSGGVGPSVGVEE
jgi:hypothetical protein